MAAPDKGEKKTSKDGLARLREQFSKERIREVLKNFRGSEPIGVRTALRYSAYLMGAAFTVACVLHRRRILRAAHYFRYLPRGPGPKSRRHRAGRMRYCVHTAPLDAPEDPETILYFLHPSTWDERCWKQLPISRAYYAFFREKGLPAPKVVSISYGEVWIYSEKKLPRRPALLKHFASEGLPRVEKRLGRPKRRLLWGMSQGGVNAIQLLYKMPGKWAGAFLSSPAIFTCDVFAGEEVLRRHAEDPGVDYKELVWGLRQLRGLVRTPKIWERHDPLVLAERGVRLPPVLVQANREDQFGFFQGTKKFAARLKENDQPVTWSPMDGGHCHNDIDQAMAFFEKILTG